MEMTLEKFRELAERHRSRVIESRRFVAHRRNHRPRCRQGSKLGEAITYLHNQWDGLVRFLDEPRVPMSNNAAERALRGAVLGRKNFAGCKSVRGTEVAALFYTVLESAKLVGVEPRDYLRAAAEAALAGQEPLLPQVYRERRRTAFRNPEIPG